MPISIPPQPRALRFAVIGLLACAPAAALRAAPQGPVGDPRRGAELYEQRCIACHAVGADRVGPRHAGVFGRRAGSVPGFAYSAALARSSLVWDEATLEAWLREPEALVPGQAMGYSVPQAADRADLIAYLRTLRHP